STFTDLTSELVVSQFYKISVAKQNSSQMVGGLQDNGGHAYSQNQWKNYYGADGMDTAIDPNNPNNMYGFIQFGGSLYFSGSGGNTRDSQVQGPEQGNWVTPLVSNSQGELFAGYSRLYKLVNNSWQPLAGPFSNNINNIAVAPSNDNIIYFSVGNQLYRSANAGSSGSLMTSASSSITSIDVHKDFPNTIYVTTAGSGGGIFTSTNGGLTLTNITGNLPNLGKNVIKHQGNHPDNPLFVGTTLGVWRKDDTQSLWEVFENNLPNVNVRDLEINLNDGNITAATYGRGIWQSDIPVVLPPSDVRIMQIASQQNGTLCGGFDQSIIVKNNGQNIINSVDVTYTVNGISNAFTWTGSIASEATQSIDFTISGVPRGNYDMEVEVDTPGDAFADNNTLIAPVTLNDFGVAQQVNTFEAFQDALIAIDIDGGLPAGSLWQRGIPSGSVLNAAASGISAYGTNLSGQYPNNTTSELITQCYDLTTIGNPILQFEMAYQIEDNWDVLYMMYSTDDGQTWSTLGSASDPNWYNSNLVGSQGQCPLCIGAQWTGSATAMT
ncbi:MAG: glycosyl hydrolase, partial [Flavobacteriaceae bacterium]|nr:glycosyl hydrolase [Flavobacteriaceae bacterium]